MRVLLPDKWRHRHYANIFAGKVELPKCEKRLAPVLEINKTGVFVLKQHIAAQSRVFLTVGLWLSKGGDAMK
jgi:hypothetical protein